MILKKIKVGKLQILFVLFSLNFCLSKVLAQVNIPNESIKIQMAYKNPAYLTFNVKYTYAAEATPTVFDDSTMGTFKISGTYYWGNLDSLEFMQNGSYAVYLYKPNKIMSINNPATVYPQIANFTLFDSLIGKNNYTSGLTYSGVNKIITMTFSNPDFPYKNYSVWYDSTSYLVNKIIYTIREDFTEYTDSYNRSVGSNTSDYTIITANYTNYQTTAFTNTIFNTVNYFVIFGGVYYPQSPYTNYEIFLASPNLFLTPDPQIQ